MGGIALTWDLFFLTSRVKPEPAIVNLVMERWEKDEFVDLLLWPKVN